jgi:hypothetical protein
VRTPFPAVIPYLVAATLALACLAGCGSGRRATGRFESRAMGDVAAVLPAQYTDVVYRHDPEGDTTFFLSDVPLDDLLSGHVPDGQVLHVELLWRPRAGQTPMDAAATNASVRHIVFSGGEVGVYGGAGFVLPAGAPGDATLPLDLRDATMQLLHATPGFVDRLSPARLSGTFNATLDPERVRAMQYAVSQAVTNGLGRSVFVRASTPDVLPAG